MRDDVPGTELEEALKKVHPFLREAGDAKLSEIRLPNLIGVGSSRSGTSTLYGMLRSNPDIYAAPMKEVNYFGICDTVTKSGPMSLREYRLCFAAQAEERYVSEVTPVYLSSPEALAAIRETLGDIKIIVNIRNPFDRIVSHFKYHRQFHGFERFDDYLDAALQQYENKVSPRQWTAPCQGILHSLYAPGLERLFALFSPANILVLQYDDLVAGGRWSVALSEFLGVEMTEEVDAVYRNQSSGEPVHSKTDRMEQLQHMVSEDQHRLSALGIEVPESWQAY